MKASIFTIIRAKRILHENNEKRTRLVGMITAAAVNLTSSKVDAAVKGFQSRSHSGLSHCYHL